MISIGQIAYRCGLTSAGDGTFEVASLAYAENAAETDLAVAFTAHQAENTKAAAVLTEPRLCLAGKTMLYCSYGEIWAALARVAGLFVQLGYYPDYAVPIAYKAQPGNYFAGRNVRIGPGTRIDPCVTIGDNVSIGKNCRIESQVFIGSGTAVGDGCVIHSGARIGADSFLHYEEDGKARCFKGVGRAVLKDGAEIGYNAVVQRGTLADTVIGERVLIGNLTVVAHDVLVGRDSRIACQSGIAGWAQLGSRVKVMGQSGVRDGVRMEDCTTLLGKSAATKNVKRGTAVLGNYGRERRQELKAQALLRQLIREG